MMFNINEILYEIRKRIIRLKSFIIVLFDNPAQIIIDFNKKKSYKYAGLIPDKLFIKCWYRIRTGKKLKLRNPIELNEKLQWLKLYDRKEDYKKIVDKLEVKKYISEKIGDEFNIPIIGVWDNIDSVSYDDLPEKFVLKCTHDSGSVAICKNKQSFIANGSIEKLRYGFNNNYFWKNREWPYKDVTPRIICEKLLENSDNTPLVDYKFYCFGGKPKYFMYSIGEAEHNVKNHKFDLNLVSIDHLFKSQPAIKKDEIVLPDNIFEMINLAQKLCEGFPHIRVDMYNIDGKIYVGEMTLFSSGGILKIESKEYSKYLADCIKLDGIK